MMKNYFNLREYGFWLQIMGMLSLFERLPMEGISFQLANHIHPQRVDILHGVLQVACRGKHMLALTGDKHVDTKSVRKDFKCMS